MQDEEIPNLEDALRSLASEVLEEESLSQQDNMKQVQVGGGDDSEKIMFSNVDSLRNQERTLLRIDRLLISGGIRSVLFLP